MLETNKIDTPNARSNERSRSGMVLTLKSKVTGLKLFYSNVMKQYIIPENDTNISHIML